LKAKSPILLGAASGCPFVRPAPKIPVALTYPRGVVKAAPPAIECR
jgi:hypothetical protein